MLRQFLVDFYLQCMNSVATVLKIKLMQNTSKCRQMFVLSTETLGENLETYAVLFFKLFTFM